MTEVLQVSESRRKAMIDYAVEFEPKLKGGAGFLVDGMIAAANSIPEGAPVGTIARRPDGGYIAVRNELGWEYIYLDITKPQPVEPYDADSWPVIYDPTEPDPLETYNQPAYFDDSPAECPCAPGSGHCETIAAPRTRTPRVVDRLGVEERDAEWTRTEISRDTYIWEYRYRGGVWKFRLLGHRNWTALRPGDEPANGPFTEVIE